MGLKNLSTFSVFQKSCFWVFSVGLIFGVKRILTTPGELNSITGRPLYWYRDRGTISLCRQIWKPLACFSLKHPASPSRFFTPKLPGGLIRRINKGTVLTADRSYATLDSNIVNRSLPEFNSANTSYIKVTIGVIWPMSLLSRMGKWFSDLSAGARRLSQSSASKAPGYSHYVSRSHVRKAA